MKALSGFAACDTNARPSMQPGSIPGRQAGRNPRHDLLALLIENEILARCRRIQLLQAILGVREFRRRFDPDQTAVVVASQNVE